MADKTHAPFDVGSLIARNIAADSAPLARAVQALRARAAVELSEVAGAARPSIVAALWRSLGGQIVVWTSSADAADRFAGDCGCYLGDAGSPVWSLRPRDDEPGAIVNPADRSARIEVLARLAGRTPGVFCVSQPAMRQPVMPAATFVGRSRRLVVGRDHAWETLLRDLTELGYERVDVVSAVGELAVRGGIIDLFPATADAPVRLEFVGDRLETARTFGLADQRSVAGVDDVFVAPWNEMLGREEDPAAQPPAHAYSTVLEYAPGALVVVDDAEMIVALERSLAEQRDSLTVAAADELEDEDDRQKTAATTAVLEDAKPKAAAALRLPQIRRALGARPALSFTSGPVSESVSRAPDVTIALPCEPAPAYGRSIEKFVQDVRRRITAGERVAVISVAHRRIREVLGEADVAVSDERGGRLLVGEGIIDAGFALPELHLVVLGDAELFGHPARRHKIVAAKEGVPAATTDLKVGQYLVHAHHGIGQYHGLEHLEIAAAARDFLVLKYAGNDRLYVPVDHMHLVRTYVATDAAPPRLSKMGGSDWARTRARVREAVDKIAAGLIKLYAARELAQGHVFAPDAPWQAELEESFPYDETPDQRAAIGAIKADMERARPMDRLVCGDVGYGKTEVAVRAAFKAIMDRTQVAVLAPTTVLAAQHARTFAERFAAFPVKMGVLSRLRSKAEARATLRALADGSLDLVIGTHRLLQKDVVFYRLGLVVVDEEQRFGVAHKERLKQLRATVDVLTLSATPIPRTLHMAMAGLRDLSLIQTAPENRLAVKTVVAPTSDALIQSAIAAELERGGQVYFVHNRIETIGGVAAAVQALVPRARVRYAHGQLAPDELEELMLAFVQGEFDVLVSTTIIENGLDIPNVNTIVVNNAERLGLAQLYQLRGRVGRGAHQAYAYLLYQPHRAMTETARSRLSAIREFSHLGSGLRLAMRDLEIRGAGNLLGRDQSGFIATVGFDEYCRILHEAVASANGQPVATDGRPPTLDVRRSAYIPDAYVEARNEKIAFYQRLAGARRLADVDAVGEELRDRFGPLPQATATLLELARMRVVASAKGVEKLALEGRRLTLEVGRRFSLSEQAIAALTAITRGNFRFTHSAIIAQLPADESRGGDDGLAAVREIIAAL